jgi:hypothetical protein
VQNLVNLEFGSMWALKRAMNSWFAFLYLLLAFLIVNVFIGWVLVLSLFPPFFCCPDT